MSKRILIYVVTALPVREADGGIKPRVSASEPRGKESDEIEKSAKRPTAEWIAIF